MVVVHETANPNDSIYGEINFEKQHYNNAFVHAFVDGNNIIEVSSTDREAWGAGYPANGPGRPVRTGWSTVPVTSFVN